VYSCRDNPGSAEPTRRICRASANADGVDNSESGLTYPRPVLSNSDGLDSRTKRKATSMVVGDDG
jgi:hypothetical protein